MHSADILKLQMIPLLADVCLLPYLSRNYQVRAFFLQTLFFPQQFHFMMAAMFPCRGYYDGIICHTYVVKATITRDEIMQRGSTGSARVDLQFSVGNSPFNQYNR